MAGDVEAAPAGAAGVVDFAIVLSDVSSHRFSKAKRFLRSIWLFGPSQVRDVEVALQQMCAALEREGFQAVRSPEQEDEGARHEILLLVTGSNARLRREHYREQLEAWVQARTGMSGGGGEFEPQEISEPRHYFSSARRIALLHPALEQLLPQLQKSVLRGGDLLTLQQCYPLHDRRFATQLLVHMSRHAFLQAQMVHQLRNEYGEKVAFYFGFRTFHQRWLRLPALLGVVLTLASRLTPERSSPPAYLAPLFGLSISLWGAAMLEAWRLQQTELAALWGVEHLREAEVMHPGFRGERTISRLNGEATLYYPRWKRLLKRCVTIPVLGAQLLLLTGVICGLYGAWIWINESSFHRALKTCLVVVLSVSWGIVVELLNWQVFVRLASALNRWENYRTTIDFEKQLAFKLFAFVFVDGFLWYFLLAFLHIPFGSELRALLSLRADGFGQTFWMHALVTSVSSLLLVPLPLASLWSIAFPILHHLRASTRTPRPTTHLTHHDDSADTCARGTLLPVASTDELDVSNGCRAAAAAAAYAAYAASYGISASQVETDSSWSEGRGACPLMRVMDGEIGDAGGADLAPAFPSRPSPATPAPVFAMSRASGFPTDEDEWPGASEVAARGSCVLRRGISAPTTVLGAVAIAQSLSDESSASDDEPCLPGTRSLLLRSVLMRRLNLASLFKAQRGKRSLIGRLRRLLRSTINADSLVDEGGTCTCPACYHLSHLVMPISKPTHMRILIVRPPYDPLLDYAHLALEFGYLLMFTVVWPLAPLACLMISALEQRAAACRLCISCRRPIPYRSNGLGSGNAWYGVFIFLLWLSVPINCGMVAIATPQLDVYFESELEPFQRLLLAVVAEHVLLSALLAIRFAFPDYPDLLLADARRVESEFKKKYLQGINTSLSDIVSFSAASEPRLTAVYPTSGPTSGGFPISLQGENLGKAVSRGEVTLLIALPREPRASPLHATFVSDRRITCTLPAVEHPGVATIRLKPSTASPMPVEPAGCSFRYYGRYNLSRLKPSSGPLHGGTAVRIFGSHFVQTSELMVCLRMHGVERRVQAFWHSETEVRFMTPDFNEPGDARVLLSLNGQQYDATNELTYHYYSSVSCTIA